VACSSIRLISIVVYGFGGLGVNLGLSFFLRGHATSK
jgi:hypothetical protein